MRSFLSNFKDLNNKEFGKVNFGAKLIRMVFHDAVDNDNLVDANNEKYTGG
jgi:hypothetical protein